MLKGEGTLFHASQMDWNGVHRRSALRCVAKSMEVELSRSVDEVQVMSAAAYARALKRHSIDTEAAKLAALVRDVCEVSRIT
jgi:hypothetical protein